MSGIPPQVEALETSKNSTQYHEHFENLNVQYPTVG